jgi:hypothetical protein
VVSQKPVDAERAHQQYGAVRQQLPKSPGLATEMDDAIRRRNTGDLRRRYGRIEGGHAVASWRGAREMVRQLSVLEHDPEKWVPVFGKDHAPPIS